MLMIVSCQEDEIVVEEAAQHTHQEEKQGFISFEALTNYIGESAIFNNSKDYFDRNITAISDGRGAEFINAYVDTDEIHLIETETINYYTLKLINNNPNDKANTFYNLVFEQDLTTGAVTSDILQFNPELSWLFDKSQSFKGDVKKYDNSLITLEDLFNGLDINNRGLVPTCTFAVANWYCWGEGHPGPGIYDGQPCGGHWIENLMTQPCPSDTDGGGGGPVGDNTNNGGGNASNGTTQTVVLELCDAFLPEGEEDSEDCVDDYSEYITRHLCDGVDSTVQAAMHNWILDNKDEGIALATYLFNNFGINNPNSCSDFNFSSYLALTDELENNPFLLLDIDCNQIQYWQTLAQHTAPSSVQNKINNLPTGYFNNFEIQSIDDAGGTMVNLDYFGVNVTTLPNNPNTGQQFTEDGFLDYIRRDFNNFVDGSTFDPYCEENFPIVCQDETALWNSTNPLGSIINIEIPGDPGVVVCSEFENDYWYFMTMNAPYAGNHPVSGTRQFGYEQNANGSYNYFVRGADRIDSIIIELLASPIVFGGADDLWGSFQDKLQEFCNSPINGGSSTIIQPIKNRPDWEDVEEVLKGDRPISDLGCN